MNHITRTVVIAINVYMDDILEENDKGTIKYHYESLSDDPQEWVIDVFCREIKDMDDDLGLEIWNYGWKNIDWEEVRNAMDSAYKHYLTHKYEDSEDDNTTSDED